MICPGCEKDFIYIQHMRGLNEWWCPFCGYKWDHDPRTIKDFIRESNHSLNKSMKSLLQRDGFFEKEKNLRKGVKLLWDSVDSLIECVDRMNELSELYLKDE